MKSNDVKARLGNENSVKNRIAIAIEAGIDASLASILGNIEDVDLFASTVAKQSVSFGNHEVKVEFAKYDGANPKPILKVTYGNGKTKNVTQALAKVLIDNVKMLKELAGMTDCSSLPVYASRKKTELKGLNQ